MQDLEVGVIKGVKIDPNTFKILGAWVVTPNGIIYVDIKQGVNYDS